MLAGASSGGEGLLLEVGAAAPTPADDEAGALLGAVAGGDADDEGGGAVSPVG